MIVAIGLMIAFIVVALYARPELRQCRWRAQRSGDGPEGRKWVCVACGAETYTRQSPPRVCLKTPE